MLAEQRVGIPTLADGTVAPQRSSRIGALVVGEGQGRYYEAVSRGNVFSMMVASTTVSAGNLVAAAAAQSTQFALWNPFGSGRNLSLLKFQVWTISGTAPVPPLVHNWATAPSIASSLVNPIQANNIGLSASSVARGVTHATGVTLTGGGALAIIRAADFGVGAGVLVPANTFEGKLTEYIDGDIVIPPGFMWVPGWMTAGSSFLVGYSVTWEEIPQ